VAASDPDAVAVYTPNCPAPILPLSLRDAQLVLTENMASQAGRIFARRCSARKAKAWEWAAAEAERAIHDNSV